MSKERARRREQRAAEAAVRARPGQQTGILAARRRLRLNLIVTALILVQAVVWIAREDWKSSLAALVVSALAFPVVVAFAL